MFAIWDISQVVKREGEMISELPGRYFCIQYLIVMREGNYNISDSLKQYTS